MRVAKEPSGRDESPLGKGSPRSHAFAAAALAVGWLVVPAAQYYAAVRRTGLQLGEPGGEAVAGLDLTPIYALLLVATILYVAARASAAGRRPGPTVAGQEADS